MYHPHDTKRIPRSPIDTLLFEPESGHHHQAQEEVRILLIQKKHTKQLLEEKLRKLQQAQMEYEIAFVDNENSVKAFDEANDRFKNFNLHKTGQWNTMYSKLVNFKNMHGHCNVSQDRSLRTRDRHDDDDDRKALGRWVGNQRVFYKYYLNGDTEHIKPHRIAALNKIGFVWDVKERKWMERYNVLVEYQKLHGHCRVTWKENKELSGWLRRQRYQYQRMMKKETTNMNNERSDLLRKIGVDLTFEKTQK